MRVHTYREALVFFVVAMWVLYSLWCFVSSLQAIPSSMSQPVLEGGVFIHEVPIDDVRKLTRFSRETERTNRGY